MTTQIKVEDHNTPFTLDWKERRWQSLAEQQESNFPLIAVVDGKRYMLHSDGTFAEVENSSRRSNMTTQIKVEDQNTPFTLDWEKRRWQSLAEQQESNFPLIAVVDGKRYELYSDGTFAEVDD